MNLGNGIGQLTYSTLVHPGDTWDEMWNSLTTFVPKVKARVAPKERFGISLRLSAASAQTLITNPAKREELKRFLETNDMYLYTVNAFPYGPFKGTEVKEKVYEPDWRSEERTQYTMNVAEVLGEIAPEGTSPSIQSAPLGFKPRVTGPDVISVREAAAFFGRRFGREPRFTGKPGGPCLLGDARLCARLLGPPAVTTPQLMEWCAAWVETGGRSLGKPTKFERTDGRF